MINEVNATKFCCEDISLIENYDRAVADKTQIWYCHHRLETHYPDGMRRVDEFDLTAKELIDKNLYYHRPANELIFLTNSEHSKLHFKTRYERSTLPENKEKFIKIMKSEEYRMKLSNSHNGLRRSEESKKKQSITCRGKIVLEETRNRMSESQKRLNWFNNGKDIVHTQICPEGFVPGRLPHNKISREKISKANTGKHWYNNGIIQTMSFECPEGFVPGVLKGRVMSKEGRQNIGKSKRGMHWYNNGITNTQAFECPKGFIPGRIKPSDEIKIKMSNSAKGKHYYNNGKVEIKRYVCPPGFIPGRLFQSKI